MIATDSRPWNGGRWCRRVGVTSTLATLLLTLCFIAPSVAQAFTCTGEGGWFWQNPLPQGSALTDVSFVDRSHGWAVGGETVLVTRDGGQTWSAQPSGVGDWGLQAVDFVDIDHGWAVGAYGTIMTTSDGGATWTPQSSDTQQSLSDVTFTDLKHGWAVGSELDAVILATSDGGITWRRQTAPPGPVSLSAVTFTDASHGWALGLRAGRIGEITDAVIITTSNSGATWTAQKTPAGTGSLYALAFPDAGHGWAVGIGGTIIATSDGGATWTIQRDGRSEGGESDNLHGVAFADQYIGVAVGNSGHMITTIDGGLNWLPRLDDPGPRSPTERDLRAVAYPGAVGGAWAVGDGGVIIGGPFGLQSTGVNEHPLRGVAFADAMHGWAVGDNPVTDNLTPYLGVILATTDGGSTWARQPSDPDDDGVELFDVDCADTSHVWAVGQGGAIIVSSSGGVVWDTQRRSSGANADNLYALDFIDAQRGWAVGAGGTILATSDGGATWGRQSSGTKSCLNDVTFIDGNHGWAVGDGVILVTANGGASWASRSGVTESALYGVSFPDAQHGWVVGGWGVIYVTSNGGRTWKRQASGAPTPLLDVVFTDAMRGWAVGASGRVIATANGGASWRDQDSGTDLELSAVTAIDAQHLWMVGDDGAILVTTTGGTPPSDKTAPVTTPLGIPAGWSRWPATISFYARDWGSGVAGTFYRLRTSGSYKTYSAAAKPLITAQGKTILQFYSTDRAGNTEVARYFTVRIDTRRPTTRAYPATVMKGETVNLGFRVNDAVPGCGSARVSLKLYQGSALKKTIKLPGTYTCNLKQTYSWRCTLAKGSYTLKVYATDLAGNAQSKVGSAKLIVR